MSEKKSINTRKTLCSSFEKRYSEGTVTAKKINFKNLSFRKPSKIAVYKYLIIIISTLY